MADEVYTPKGGSEGKTFAIHPATTVGARIIDVVNLGTTVEQFPGSPEKLSPKVALVIQSTKINPDTSKPFEPFLELTLSFNEKANLRKVLEGLRGKPYTEAEVEHGVPLHKLVNFPCLMTIAHVQTRKGRTFGKVMSLTPVPEGMPVPEAKPYTRNDKFWTIKKEAYHAATVAFEQRLAHEASNAAAFPADVAGFGDLPAALGDDSTDELPF